MQLTTESICLIRDHLTSNNLYLSRQKKGAREQDSSLTTNQGYAFRSNFSVFVYWKIDYLFSTFLVYKVDKHLTPVKNHLFIDVALID